jgi:repressor LexA
MGCDYMTNNLGNKETMSKNIKHYMDLNHVDRNDLCQSLGVKYTTLSDWINAKTYPRIDKIELMSNYFKISKADLVEKHGEAAPRCGVRIPVLGKVVAGVPLEAITDIIDYEEIEPELAKTGEFFALQIRGDSMEPKLYEGDVVIVKKQPTVDSGETAIILINGDEATVKQVKEMPAGIMLIGHNTAVYEPHFYSNEEIEKLPVQILGKVVELRRKF